MGVPAVLLPRDRLLAWLAVPLLGVEALGLATQLQGDRHAFVVVALVQGALYAAALAVVWRGGISRRGLMVIVGTAILLRLVALAAPVFLSTDIYRYIWDGRVQAAGINPYRYIPVDPHLAALQDWVFFPKINRNSYAPTIYPPFAQMLFLLVTRFSETVLGMKLALVALEALGLWALFRILRATDAPPERILLYAWHPLPVWEIAGSGHVDAVVVAAVAVALLAGIAGRRVLSGAALAAATLVKFFPLVLVPAIWRSRDWRWAVAFVAVIVVLYLPYLQAGPLVLGFFPAYAAEEHFTWGGGFWLVDVARVVLPVPGWAYIGFAAAVMAGLAIAALRRSPDAASDLAWARIMAVAAVLLVSPHYAWYFVWLVMLLTAAPWWPALWPTLTAVLLYWQPLEGRIPMWVGFVIYGGFACLVLGDVALRSRRVNRIGERHDVFGAR